MLLDGLKGRCGVVILWLATFQLGEAIMAVFLKLFKFGYLIDCRFFNNIMFTFFHFACNRLMDKLGIILCRFFMW